MEAYVTQAQLGAIQESEKQSKLKNIAQPGIQTPEFNELFQVFYNVYYILAYLQPMYGSYICSLHFKMHS